MEWMPAIHLGWLNGWIAIALVTLTEGMLFLAFPKDVVQRLFDRSGWSPPQIAFTVIGKLSAAFCLAVLILTPLKLNTPFLYIGLVISSAGAAGLAKALFDFKATPLSKPVTRGMYRVSRHPQIVMASLILLGGCIAIGSWSALLSWLLARVFSHFGILGEEAVCRNLYGEAYAQYLKQVPRYFLFF
ncbi:MAG: DUF1295 domain-containing protein [Anaerolineales bacterium]|nr:DUF1295 domain-containing protein [Anaerolineales bacterium]